MLFMHCCSAGDLRRASGLLARYGFLLHEGGNPSVLLYNLLMKVCFKTKMIVFLASGSGLVSPVGISLWLFTYA